MGASLETDKSLEMDMNYSNATAWYFAGTFSGFLAVDERIGFG